MTEKKRYTYLNASKSSFIGSFFCNDIPLTNQEVVELLKENEMLKQELFEARRDYLIETADISDKLHIEEWIEKERKEIFK